MGKILEENIKPRTVITYLMFGLFAVLVITQLPIPDLLRDLIMVMQGFWFGTKITQKTEGK